MEIPTGDKTYVFLELDKKDIPEAADPDGDDCRDHHLFTNDLDKWIAALREVS